MSASHRGKTSALAEHVPIVLRALCEGPRTGTDLRDRLATACDGSKDNVTRALRKLKDDGLVRGVEEGRRCTWHLTQAGITEAMRLIAERREARAEA